MKKTRFDQSRIEKNIYRGEQANIYQLKDGAILKLFNPLYLQFFKSAGYDLERKIISAKPI